MKLKLNLVLESVNLASESVNQASDSVTNQTYLLLTPSYRVPRF